jgi:riboflavin biosynthesis pyrimidine reductase
VSLFRDVTTRGPRAPVAGMRLTANVPAEIPLLPDTTAGLDRYYGDPPRGVRANMVQSIDGAGAFHGRTKQITDPADQFLLQHLRGLSDAVLVGGATVQAEHYGPVMLADDVQSARTAAGHAAVPPLVVVTARALLSPDLRIFGATGPRPIIVTLTAAKDAADNLRDLADVEIIGDELDPARIVAMLHDRGLDRILCEGGPFLLSQLIEADLVDDMCLTVSPYLASSQPTTPQPPSAREVPTRLRLRHVLTHQELLYLRYTRES